MRIQIINGPNLNLLGTREPGIYGQQSFDEYLPLLQARYPDLEISYYQSNVEGELINKMQEVGFSFDGIVLNAGAYTHTSIGKSVVELAYSDVFVNGQGHHHLSHGHLGHEQQ